MRALLDKFARRREDEMNELNSLLRKKQARTGKALQKRKQRAESIHQHLKIAKEQYDQVGIKDPKLLDTEGKLERKIKELEKNLEKKCCESKKKGIKEPWDSHGFCTREKFAKYLKDQCGFKIEKQHIFHIIACSNGGADHRDNYLYALGATFNSQIQDNYDCFNCYLADKDKTEAAIKACVLAETLAKEELGPKHMVEARGGKKKPTYWSQGRHY